MGGYCCPFLSTLGSHVHHCSLGTSSMTLGTCWPQPNHVACSVKEVLRVWRGNSEVGILGRTAFAARGFVAHCNRRGPSVEPYSEEETKGCDVGQGVWCGWCHIQTGRDWGWAKRCSMRLGDSSKMTQSATSMSRLMPYSGYKHEPLFGQMGGRRRSPPPPQ
jgi:hypothetical protein